MFDENSRYAGLETLELTAPDGRRIRFVRRRFLPEGDALPLLAQVTVGQAGRLDLIAARQYGASEQWWRICDASNAMNPVDLENEPGRRVRVPRIGTED